MTMTKTTASSSRSIAMLGSSHAVTANAIAETTSVMSRRLTSARGPPRHVRRTWSWVAYIAAIFIGPSLKTSATRTQSDCCDALHVRLAVAAGGACTPEVAARIPQFGR